MSVIIRQLKTSDYQPIIEVVNDWWGGRQMAEMLPKLFFIHFQNSSFLAEEDRKRCGFLVGFRSQTHPLQAYIHFVGVDPQYRGKNIGRRLYYRFFRVAQSWGCSEVRSITSPQNKGSIAFHTQLGFTIDPGDNEVDGIPFTRNYDGHGGDRVLFRRQITLEEVY